MPSHEEENHAQSRWTDEFLDRMRQIGDPLADETVQAVVDSGEVTAVNNLLTCLVRNDDIPAGPWPAAIADYLRASERLPDWTNAHLIAKGEQLFLRYGITSFAILACASLPECYVLRDVAAVLGTTQRLTEHARRRIFETAWMVLAVMAEGGLASGGTGIRVTQKVRLMHAAIRRLILTPPPAAPTLPPRTLADALLAQDWPADRGVPISQEDLAAVSLTFSHVILRGWQRLGIVVTPGEAEAYLHCWNVVGHILGICDEVLPQTVKDANALFEAIKQRRALDTPDGRALTVALVSFCEGIARRPRILVRPIVRILMRGLLGPKTSDMLGVPKLSLWHQAYRIVLRTVVPIVNALKSDLFHALPGLGGVSAMLSRQWLEDVVSQPRGGNRTAFRIPDRLIEQWRLEQR